MKISDAVVQAADDLSLRLAETTARTYRVGLRHFVAHLRKNGVRIGDDITKLTIDHFISFPGHLAREKLARGTMAVYNAAARALLDSLVIANLLETDYAATARLEKSNALIARKRERKIPKAPKAATVTRVLSAAANRRPNVKSPVRERDNAFLLLLASSGCRIAEAAGLKVRDVDLRERRALVLGKGSAERYIRFNTEAADALRAYWSARTWYGKDDPCFARHDKAAGKQRLHLTTVGLRNAFDDIVEQAGLEKGTITPHSLRHNVGKTVLAETGNLKLAQQILGHKSTATTEIYAVLADDEVDAAYRQVFD